jgi:dihydroorotate dehydrogenase electron transfer subunit
MPGLEIGNENNLEELVMPKSENAEIISNRQVADKLWEMEILAPGVSSQSSPGQFVHLRVTEHNDPLLRRPLSLYDVDKANGIITLLFKVVGRGTQLLSECRAGDYLDLMGPLGRGFTMTEGQKTILVGGGVGIAPLLYLCRELISRSNQVTVLYGAGSAAELCGLERFASLGADLNIATNDGSYGTRGLVTDILKAHPLLAEAGYIYTCGPEVMMAKVAELARQNNVKGEVSLEEHMACGVGACLGCARKLKQKDTVFVKICKDGPVFSMDEIELAEVN